MRDAGLSRRLSDLLADERGGGTIMGLFWFMILVAAAGLAVDTTDGFRNRTMLQATADSAALAGAIDLPDKAQVVDTTLAYSANNMGASLYGGVLDSEDVEIGIWDHDTRLFVPDAPDPNAVRVVLRRAAQNDNAVPVNFLRIIGLETWNVHVVSVAQRFIPECLRDGLIARGIVDISSSNDFVNGICVHGEQGVHMQNHNFYEYDTGVVVSMPDYAMMQIPADGMNSNPGLREALRENYLDPRMVNHVDEVMQAFIKGDRAVLPDFMTGDVDANSIDIKVVDEKFKLDEVEEGHIYHVQCAPNKNAKIPANSTISNVVIIADCELHIGAWTELYNVVLGSRSGGNGKIDKANVSVAANAQIGLPDNCIVGGGVQIFSNATIHTASSTKIDGVQMVAAGDIGLGAQDYGINGISAQSGGNITMTSNNQFGLCGGGAPDLFTVPYYRLVL